MSHDNVAAATDKQPSDISPIKVCGRHIQNAVKLNEQRIALLEDQFPKSMYIFDGEEKPHPDVIEQQLTLLYQRAARLRTAQLYLNLHVRTTSGALLCSELADRARIDAAVARWKRQAGTSQKSRYGFETSTVETTRSTDVERAKRLVSEVVAAVKVDQARVEASSLKDRIAAANAVPIQLPAGMLEPEDLSVDPVDAKVAG